MEYFCESCNYKTTSASNFCHHKKTKKHIEKSTIITNNISNSAIVESNAMTNLQCKNCQTVFKHYSSLYRHKKKCLDKNKHIDKELLDMKFELLEKEFNLKLEYERKEKELYKTLEKEKTELLNNFMNNANNLLNKTVDNNKVTAQAMQNVSMSAIKFANEKFKNAPALLPIQNFNINNLDFNNEDDKKQLIEILIYNAKQKSLDKLLGDHIVKEYKKEKPEDQMFHTTDCSRLNYIVRQLMENALIWSIDKSGIEICSSIIKPLIKKCIDTLLEHQKYLLKEMGNGDLSKQTDVELIISILMSIDSGTLETEINKYIAPYFNLDKSK
jgi:hypothetical protein